MAGSIKLNESAASEEGILVEFSDDVIRNMWYPLTVVICIKMPDYTDSLSITTINYNAQIE